MKELAAALSAAMSGAPTLSVLDTEADRWAQRPWPEMHARAENIAERTPPTKPQRWD